MSLSSRFRPSRFQLSIFCKKVIKYSEKYFTMCVTIFISFNPNSEAEHLTPRMMEEVGDLVIFLCHVTPEKRPRSRENLKNDIYDKPLKIGTKMQQEVPKNSRVRP